MPLDFHFQKPASFTRVTRVWDQCAVFRSCSTWSKVRVLERCLSSRLWKSLLLHFLCGHIDQLSGTLAWNQWDAPRPFHTRRSWPPAVNLLLLSHGRKRWALCGRGTAWLSVCLTQHTVFINFSESNLTFVRGASNNPAELRNTLHSLASDIGAFPKVFFKKLLLLLLNSFMEVQFRYCMCSDFI